MEVCDNSTDYQKRCDTFENLVENEIVRETMKRNLMIHVFRNEFLLMKIVL